MLGEVLNKMGGWQGVREVRPVCNYCEGCEYQTINRRSLANGRKNGRIDGLLFCTFNDGCSQQGERIIYNMKQKLVEDHLSVKDDVFVKLKE